MSKRKEKSIDISVIIPTYNRVKSLKQSVSSLLNQQTQNYGLKVEIIIALDVRDNQSRPWIERQLKNQAIAWVQADTKGANAARNAGLKKACGELIFFLDDDCLLLDTQGLKKRHDLLQCYEDIAGAGGPYLLKGRADILSTARNLLDNFFMREHIYAQHKTTRLLGGNAIYRKSVFSACGCFNDRMIYGATETEFNERLIGAGCNLGFFECLGIVHASKQKNPAAALKKSFSQGWGHGYFFRKKYANARRSWEKPWFWRICREFKGSLFEKSSIGFILLQLAMAYHAGSFAGNMFYKLKQSKGFAKQKYNK